MTKVSDDVVRAIIGSPLGVRAAARFYGLSASEVSRIRAGKRRKAVVATRESWLAAAIHRLTRR